MTVRPPGVERKSSHGIHGQSRKHKEERGEQGMYNKKYSMDSDYRWEKSTRLQNISGLFLQRILQRQTKGRVPD